ncbi:MAG TPA: DoxX family protein [Solirubrobacteraceae bacterium]|nr:DoxX family protein [Solirubrobacteraceae bacterium]
MSTVSTGRAITRLPAQFAAIAHARTLRASVLLIARIALAWVFMYHGAGKLFDFKHQGGIAGTTAFFQLEGIPAAHLFAYVVGLTEFVGGLMMLLGLATALAGLALTVDMLVAIVTATGATGMLPKALPHGIVADGFEINLALGALALTVAAMGAGELSLDRLLGWGVGRGWRRTEDRG